MRLTDLLGIRVPEVGDAPNWPADLARAINDLEANAVMDFASAADRAVKLQGVPLQAGMLTYLRDLRWYQYWNGSSWQNLVYVGERFRVADRPENNLDGVGGYVDLAPGDYRPVLGYAWTNAPAGEYQADITFNAAAIGGNSAGFCRTIVNGVNLSLDHTLDLDGITRPIRLLYPFTHAGGNLVFNEFAYRPTGATVRVRNRGTKVVLSYLGARITP